MAPALIGQHTKGCSSLGNLVLKYFCYFLLDDCVGLFLFVFGFVWFWGRGVASDHLLLFLFTVHFYTITFESLVKRELSTLSTVLMFPESSHLCLNVRILGHLAV